MSLRTIQTHSDSSVPLIDELFLEACEHGYTLSALANRSGVSRTTLKNWFSGRTTRPQVPTLNAVGKLFGLQLKWNLK